MSLTAVRRGILFTAVLASGLFACSNVFSGAVLAVPPPPGSSTRPPLVGVGLTVNGQKMALQLGDTTAGNALLGSLYAPVGTGAYVTIQQCTLDETGCMNVLDSTRSYPASATTSNNMTSLPSGPVAPAAGSTYRSCVIVSVRGSLGGGCTPMVYQGGQAFIAVVSIAVNRYSSDIVGVNQAQQLNGQYESLYLDTWICDMHGADCSIAAHDTITSHPPLPENYTWADTHASVPGSHGHTYKTCAIMTVRGAAAGACTPLIAY